MKHALAIIFAIASITVSQAAFSSAVLIDAKGDVKVAAPGQPALAATSGMELVNGSTVAVGAGASASVLLESGAMDQIPPGGSYRVGEATGGGNRTNLGSGITLAMRELAAQGDGPTIHGMVREAKGPSDKLRKLSEVKGFGISAIYPRGTSIRLGPTLKFEWEPTPRVDWPAPALVIDDAGKKQVTAAPIPEGSTTITLDTATIGLKKGQNYSWYLATRKPAVKGKTMRFTFKALTATDEGRINSEISKIHGLKMGADGTDLLIAQLYYKDGLYEDMVKTLLPLWNRNKAPFIRKLLRLGYSKMGQTEKASQFSR